MSETNPAESDDAGKTPDFTACPHWGKGGRYTLDPATGQRTPVVDVAEPQESAADQKPVKKGK